MNLTGDQIKIMEDLGLKYKGWINDLGMNRFEVLMPNGYRAFITGDVNELTAFIHGLWVAQQCEN